jgi:thioredoxin reductase
MKQLVIIGGGPAGISASIYAARKKMDFVLITKEVGGQVIKAGNIENYLGGDGVKALFSIYHDLTYGVSSWI